MALRELERPEIEGFWIHLDADVLDQTVMPAVDSPNPHGLSYRDLVAILQVLVRSDRLAGMEITILDPELDPGRRYAAELTAAIVESFRPRSDIK
jgi:arginase